MLPHAYELPAALFLLAGGALACFAGYRLFRIVLGIYGFILGAAVVSSMMGSSNTVGMVAGAIAGGLAGALLMVFAYFVGIAIVGAGLGVAVAHVAWTQATHADPPAVAVIVCSILGAIGAMVLQRYVIVVGTAFGGAWTMIVGAMSLTGARDVAKAATARPWILYPMSPAAGPRWVPAVWIVLGLVGTAIQLGVTGRRR